MGSSDSIAAHAVPIHASPSASTGEGSAWKAAARRRWSSAASSAGKDHLHDRGIAAEDGREAPGVERAPEPVRGIGFARNHIHESHADAGMQQSETDARTIPAERTVPQHNPVRPQLRQDAAARSLRDDAQAAAACQNRGA